MGRYSILQLLVVVTIIAAFLSLVVPRIQRAREAARRMSCQGHMKQLGLALHNYHSAYKHFPAAMSGNATNGFRLSGWIVLTPFFEGHNYWRTVSSSSSFGGVAYPPMGPSPQDESFPPWRTEFTTLRCPSDPSYSDSRQWERPLKTLAKVNYAFSVGDRVSDLYACQSIDEIRGAFAPHQITKFRDLTDGLSYTLCLAEIATANGRRLQGQYSVGHPNDLADNPGKCFETRDSERLRFYDSKQKLSKRGRGGAFADGSGGLSLVNTVLPPNAPSCAIETSEPLSGIFSAGSYHPGGCNVMLADGSIHFVSETVDCGNRHAPSPRRMLTMSGDPIPSGYGVWGGLGTRAGNDECVELEY